jgi:hypothetical protein
MDLKKHIWEGWTLQDFIDELAPAVANIMGYNSWREPFKTKEELKKWCIDNQSYYKKHIPEVVTYFANRYKIK